MEKNRIDYAFKVEQGSKVNLKDFKTDYTDNVTKQDAESHFNSYNQELGELQELLRASASNSVLIGLQGMDTSGKDGTIRHVMSSLNPQGCQVSSFKVPTPEEQSHDFLWRIHSQTPGKGLIGIFNRSHYEDVLVVRVHNLQPQQDWDKVYEHINAFEKLLTDSGTLILKFFLHISKEEQLERLVARESSPFKQWKLATGDYLERNYWDEYQKYYETALSQCSTAGAPWWIVPADRKWYRNLAVAETLVEYLRPYKNQWKEQLELRGKKALDELQTAREQGLIPQIPASKKKSQNNL